MQYFSLNTNVKQLRIGRGVSKGIGKELGKYVVATMEIPWNIIKNDMGKSPEKVINVTSVEKQWIEDQIKELSEFDTIVGIGGGMAIDVAKYISWKLNKKLVSIPTILLVLEIYFLFILHHLIGNMQIQEESQSIHIAKMPLIMEKKFLTSFMIILVI